MGYFLLQYVIFSQKMKVDGAICGEKKILSTENYVRPSRDDRDHVLITTIDGDQMDVH
jgi:hypothetical protein